MSRQTGARHFDVEIKRGKQVITMLRIEAVNKGVAIGKARQQYLDHTLSFKAFSVNKDHNV